MKAKHNQIPHGIPCRTHPSPVMSTLRLRSMATLPLHTVYYSPPPLDSTQTSSFSLAYAGPCLITRRLNLIDSRANFFKVLVCRCCYLSRPGCTTKSVAQLQKKRPDRAFFIFRVRIVLCPSVVPLVSPHFLFAVHARNAVTTTRYSTT